MASSISPTVEIIPNSIHILGSHIFKKSKFLWPYIFFSTTVTFLFTLKNKSNDKIFLERVVYTCRHHFLTSLCYPKLSPVKSFPPTKSTKTSHFKVTYYFLAVKSKGCGSAFNILDLLVALNTADWYVIREILSFLSFHNTTLITYCPFLHGLLC